MSTEKEISKPSMEDEHRHRIAEKIERELGATITRMLKAPDVLEIMLNDDGQLWVDRLGQDMQLIGCMPAWQAEALIGTVASTLRLSVTHESPILECELPADRSRFAAAIPPIVRSPVFTIRRKALRIFTLDDYVADGILSQTHRNAIIRAIDAKENILVVGGTSTGKTTLTNAIIDGIAKRHPGDRIVIIEDTAELQCAAENRLLFNTSAYIDMRKILKLVMRMHPHRIMVGEVRDGTALDLLKAWNTGHPGGVATVHANGALKGLIRIEQLVAEVTSAPMQQVIAASIDVIIAIQKTPAGRRVDSVVKVHGHDGQNYVTTLLEDHADAMSIDV